VNGAADGASASHAIAASTAANFSLGVDSGATWNGQVDEAFFYGGALAGPSICRITSCGIDGGLCACDAATPSSYRACAVDADCGGTARCDTTSGLCQGRRHATPGGGGCTLPACNQPTP
jgi:hypothetical protein